MTTGSEVRLVHRLFEQQVGRMPERVAVVCADGSLTYAELDRRANQLAHLLISRGVGPEAPVALCVERSAYLPIGMLAILKAGGTYVPLDPEHPPERIAHILGDTRAVVVIAHEPTRPRVGDDTPILLLDRDADDIARQPGDTPSVPDDPRRLAYVMYTSGSTGRPKGVLVDHRALSARFPLGPYDHLLGPGDVLAAITHVSWNPSVFEVLYTLARGATIALAPREVMRDPARLGRFLDEQGVTFMRAVPSLWQAMIDAGWAGRPDMVIGCHGERLGPRLAAELARRGKSLSNTYGSTEASAFSRVDFDAEGRCVLPRVEPIERELVRVLTADLAPAQVGEVGEIHIGGDVVARGYLNDPALTALRFVPDPSGAGRLYKTGDLGRTLADAGIELLGRADQQVKIRGQRIELGEVEAAIARYPGVAEVVALAREDTPGDQRLVAYLVLGHDASFHHDALRAHLHEALPAFMVPSSFVVLAALPLNPNGKVDRAALPPPRRVRPAFADEPVAARTEAEAIVVALFSEVLGHDEIGIDDDFFELGGHSLLAAQVASRLRARCDVDVSLVAFYDNTTPRKLGAEVERRLAAGERSSLPIASRAEARGGAPLSFAQERLWFLNRLTPGDFAYNLPSAMRLVGPLDVSALRASIDGILQRHEALRTRFSTDPDGRPTQTVEDLDSLGLPLVDLGHLPAEAREDAVRAELARAALAPFDLSSPPLLGAALYRLSPTEHVFFVNMHHVASDGWSKAVFRRELALGYNARSRGETPALPALPFQVLDFAAWQRRHLSGGEIERQLTFWRTELDGLETLALPTDHPRPRVFTHRGAREELRLPRALAASLEALAHRHGASLFMVLLAAFDTLLFRYTGQTDIAVGAPIAGRNLPETEGLIGFFVNTLVLRARPHGELRFSELLAEVKRSALSAYAHQDLPFERLVSELNPERDMGRHPLVQVVLALQNTPWDEVPFAGLAATTFDLPHEMTRLDLELHIWERGGGLLCHLIYCTDLFEPWRMAQLLRHFATLLEAIISAPDARLQDFDILRADERERIAVAWNDTGRPFPRDRCLHQLFASKAARAPERLAVARGAERLTYRELDARANQLARFLHRKGIGPGARVGLGLERSPALLVAILGVLAAGAAWVPLDPDYPRARLEVMLADSGALLLITRAALAERFPPTSERLLIDDDWPLIAGEPSDDPGYPCDPEQLAYVLYTSGSTGAPSGVEVAHRGLVNLVTWFVEAHEVTADDRATLVASPSFDASLLETWPYLVSGASLHIPDDHTRLVPSQLVDWLAEQAITIGFLPTVLLELCLDHDLARTSLRALVTGGDRLARRPPAGLPLVLYNHYGPTESSVCATFAPVLPSSDERLGPPPIGRPIANTRAYVLDPAGRLVPIGVPGELHLAGVGLARGYSNRPELTALRFIPNPFGEGRLYRTGDLVRWRADGELEFLGRVDAQVKIRGYRVEPAEIDAALSRCPGVRECVTICREDAPGDKRLVSYLVPAPVRRDDPLIAEYLARWQALYDAEYAETRAVPEPERDITGWNSSFTGEPIPAEDMREWVETRVREILRHRPERVLEIGCGTGLLLFPISRRVHRYVASDFSKKAIAGLRRRVAADPALCEKVSLHEGPAHDLSWLAGDASFDTVILNSVAQYFPSADHLSEVLEQAASHVGPGGRIFVGDVRNHDLFRDFHEAVERFAAGDDIPASELDQRVEARMRRDKELLLAPSFFERLKGRVPAISAVEIRPERGRAETEMTMFRYDVTLHVARAVRGVAAREVHWARDVGDLSALERALRESSDAAVLVRQLVDRRRAGATGVDLEALQALAERLNRRTDMRLGPGSRTVDALFLPAGEPDEGPIAADGFFVATDPVNASDPLRPSIAQRLLPEIRDHLRNALPDYMMPAAFVWLDRLPLTPSGKLDRKRLPRPRAEGLTPTAAPSTPTEETVGRIYAQALGLAAVGPGDNFFELGGHSLLAVQVIAAIHDQLGVDLPLAALFEAPTTAELAARVDAVRARRGRAPVHLSSDERVTRLPLTPIDVNFHYAQVFFRADKYAWHQVMEIALEPVDVPRLEAACLYAVNRHPIARGRISSRTALGKRAYWDVGALLSRAPLTIHEATDDAHVERLAESIVAAAFPLDEAPSVRFSLIRGGRGDRFFIRYNHGAIDGSGLHCLVSSIITRYLGREDPVQRVIPLTTAELLAYYEHPESHAANPVSRYVDNNELAHLASLVPDRLFGPRRHRRLATRLAEPSRIFPARLHAEGGNPRDRGSAVVELGFSEVETGRLTEAARRLRSTLDRLFIAGFLDGGVAWNRAHGLSGARIEAYWAVNLRPPRLFDSIVANQFAWSRVRAPDGESHSEWLAYVLDPANDFLLRGALDFARFVERFHTLDVPDALRWLSMTGIKRNAPSMVISNTLTLGELELGAFSEAFGVRSVKLHSREPLTDRPGIIIGNRGERVHLRMIYPRALFDARGATRFLETCRDCALALTT